MRYVDIRLLDLPSDWQTRADQALRELRDEVDCAESDALAAGHNVAEARKKAISDGLGKKSRQDVWRDLAPKLKEVMKDKCWYSESKNPTSDKNVDHFRPKQRVHEDINHEGYWWLAFDWRNFRYASQWCNQHRNDKVNDTKGGKADRFPLRSGSFRAQCEAEDFRLEDVELLDPLDPGDWKLITFRPDGYPIPARIIGTPEHNRALISIDVYHLDCEELVKERKALAGSVQRIVQSMELLRPKITDPLMRELYKQEERDLIQVIDRYSEYSAAALAYARAEIYKTICGQQVKREWLEEILNSNP